MPHFSHTLSVSAPPQEVFAIMDDFTKTPQWLSRCTGIDKLDSGPNEVGTKLTYHYHDSRRTGTMDGEIVAREPARHFAMKFSDKMMDVTVDFVAASDGVGTTLTHTIDIATKGVGKVFSPLIKRQLPNQTLDAMTKLKAMAESGMPR
ncbi:SRPBCC family protein [Pedococcus sp. 5OH_020]|uniref:SRPBCC family protein n=1 Tax=Pedococcus sp. 5OH_020 TaxID=2989814 RepID=UPI0022E9F568|nr:SRPBCC family protein [Pedococcus sp. 5OH_020]